jgi:hypothetical protein
MWWVEAESGKYNLVVSPLHGRANKNGAGDGAKLLEYLMPADPSQPWETRVIEDTMHMTHNLDPIQWDKDAAQEILYGGKEAIVLLDRGGDSAWKKMVIASPEKTPEDSRIPRGRGGTPRESKCGDVCGQHRTDARNQCRRLHTFRRPMEAERA